MHDVAMRQYLEPLNRRLWAYRQQTFGAADGIFDSTVPSATRPPVFRKGHEDDNVIVSPQATKAEARAVRDLVPARARHRHFASMRSSQALVLTVFGNFHVLGRLDVLAGVVADEGLRAFLTDMTQARLALERVVADLGEPSPTSVDVTLEGADRVCVEAKLSEADVGHCSRPGKPNHPYPCDGSYTLQHHRRERCALAAQGVRYWRYIPALFPWRVDVDHRPCPLAATYQIVRNVLAACVVRGRVVLGNHALLLYDARNPAWRPGGAGDRAYGGVRAALRYPETLRRCPWQRVVARLQDDPAMRWLAQALGDKYGLFATDDPGPAR